MSKYNSDDVGWLKEVLEAVKKEVDSWPSWMRDREYSPDESKLDNE